MFISDDSPKENTLTLAVPILRASLGNVAGEYVEADINLAERIGNDNGNFSFN